MKKWLWITPPEAYSARRALFAMLLRTLCTIPLLAGVLYLAAWFTVMGGGVLAIVYTLVMVVLLVLAAVYLALSWAWEPWDVYTDYKGWNQRKSSVH